MKPFLIKRLDEMSARLTDLEFLLARSDVAADAQAYRALSREHAGLTAATQRYAAWRKRRADLDLARQLQSEPDIGMAALATEEAAQAEADLQALESQLHRMLIPADPDDSRAAFLEIRAGTGGDESALFAADLLRMYSRFADRMGWRVELLSESASDLGGLREVVARVSAPGTVSPDAADDVTGVYGMLRFESGGHRVQRVPATESQGRIHTSACTVAVMPEPDETAAVRLDPSQLRIDTFRASGAGGQHVNKTDSAVRITHLPTGLVAECQDDRSQHRNKARALQVLAARIEERERSERLQRDAALRRGLIGTGDRSDRIRTYNFPQGRVTDHRINLTLYRLSAVLEGDLSELILALRHAHEAQLLAEMEQAVSGA